MALPSTISTQETSINQQILRERTFSRPPAAKWGLKILKTLKLERLLTIGNAQDI